MPTVLDALNINYPNKRPLDGLSLLNALNDNKKEREKSIGFIYEQNISWVTDRYKLICDKNLENFELYDVLKDKPEKQNIIDKYPEIAENLKAGLLDWLESVKKSEQGMDYN